MDHRVPLPYLQRLTLFVLHGPRGAGSGEHRELRFVLCCDGPQLGFMLGGLYRQRAIETPPAPHCEIRHTIHGVYLTGGVVSTLGGALTRRFSNVERRRIRS